MHLQVPQLRLDWILHREVNSNQRKVISAIVHSNSCYPLVVFGPFGTGKTFTLNQSVRQLVTDSTNRILVCTHSNRAADKHVELLDDYLSNNGIKATKPLRIYHSSRRYGHELFDETVYLLADSLVVPLCSAVNHLYPLN